MDLSSFSDENFNAFDFINKTFRSFDRNEQTSEVQITSLVSKLQLYVQQVNSSLEDTSQQVLQNMPKVMHEAELIQKEALALKEKMSIIKEEISKIERGTESSMAALEKLDNMKSTLHKAKQALQEADNWTVLANDIEDVFESHNIDAIAAKVVSMQQSLVVLENANDYENRKLQLEGYKNRLEAIVSPLLVKAFTSNNIDESRRYVTMFSSIERLPQLVQYYCRCQKGSLCRQWENTVDLDQEHSVLEWIKTFYDVLLSDWQAQVKWCQAVFKSVSMLPGLYAEVLETLENSIVSAIDDALKRQMDPLPYLIQLKEESKNFWNNMKVALSQQGWNAEGEEAVRLRTAVYKLFGTYISGYGALEEVHLLAELAPATSGDLADTVRALGSRNAHALVICRRALSRCAEFTDHCGYSGLISALQFCLMKFIEEYLDALRQIDIEKSNREEWIMFKICLTLLQRTGGLIADIKKLDKEIRDCIVGAVSKKKEGGDNIVLLTKSAQEGYNNLVQKVSKGDTFVLGEVIEKLEKVNTKVYQTCVNVMYAEISTVLEKSRVFWSTQEATAQPMPDYSYAPAEYITQIGEYLMTLPQHLEPLVAGDASDQLLGAIASRTSAQYADIILLLSHLSPASAGQLAADISYLGDVLEDIGCNLSESLQQICLLLKLPADTYQSQTAGFSPKLVATVRQLRNITAS